MSPLNGLKLSKLATLPTLRHTDGAKVSTNYKYIRCFHIGLKKILLFTICSFKGNSAVNAPSCYKIAVWNCNQPYKVCFDSSILAGKKHFLFLTDIQEVFRLLQVFHIIFQTLKVNHYHHHQSISCECLLNSFITNIQTHHLLTASVPPSYKFGTSLFWKLLLYFLAGLMPSHVEWRELVRCHLKFSLGMLSLFGVLPQPLLHLAVSYGSLTCWNISLHPDLGAWTIWQRISPCNCLCLNSNHSVWLRRSVNEVPGFLHTVAKTVQFSLSFRCHSVPLGSHVLKKT